MPNLGEIDVNDTAKITEQLGLFIFDGKTVDFSTFTFTGSLDDDVTLPDTQLDGMLTLRVTVRVKKVAHKRDKDGRLERAHTLEVEGASVAK